VKKPRSVRQATVKIRQSGMDIRKSTVHNVAKVAGLKSYVQQKKPLLSQAQKHKRLAFATKFKDFDWKSVIFSDETTFQLMGNKGRRRFWATSPAEVPTAPAVKYPEKLHVWAGFSYYGKTRLYCFTGNMNAPFYLGILQERLLKDATAMFGSEPWVFLQDSDPKHTSNRVREWLEENVEYIPKADWPANSPDINCLENLWAVLKKRVNERQPRNLEELQRAIEREWDAVTPGQIQNLVNSMDRRLAAVRENQGGSTSY
jgi:hypothetical protein